MMMVSNMIMIITITMTIEALGKGAVPRESEGGGLQGSGSYGGPSCFRKTFGEHVFSLFRAVGLVLCAFEEWFAEVFGTSAS